MDKKYLNVDTWFVEDEEFLDLNGSSDQDVSTRITKDNVTKYAKGLNPELFKKKKKYLILSIAFFVVGLIITIPIPIFLPLVIISIVLFIIFLNINKRIKNIKKSVISLKTYEQFIHYYNESLSVKENEFGIRCGNNAIYTEDNVILAAKNICLVYTSKTRILFIPIKRKIVFGTTSGELINYSHKITDQKSKFILNFMANSNPQIMIGETTENINNFVKIMKKSEEEK